MTQDEANFWQNLRGQRNLKLAQCDWTQAADAPPTVNKQAWATYRQTLRDLPQNTTYAAGMSMPNWPTNPAGGI